MKLTIVIFFVVIIAGFIGWRIGEIIPGWLGVTLSFMVGILLGYLATEILRIL